MGAGANIHFVSHSLPSKILRQNAAKSLINRISRRSRCPRWLDFSLGLLIAGDASFEAIALPYRLHLRG